MIPILILRLCFFELPNIIHAADIICDGSFQSYTPTNQDPLMEYYQYFPSNFSCWYNQNGGQIEIKDSMFNLPIGKCADLITSSRIVLCQDVMLIKDQVYEIGFQVGNTLSINSSTIITQVNGVLVGNFTLYGQFVLGDAKEKFLATQNTNTLCFKSSDTRLNTNYMNRGPVISKIKLVKINKKQIFLFCQKNPEQLSGISIQCDTTDLMAQIIQLLKPQIQLFIQEQPVKLQQINTKQNSIQFFVDYQKSIKLTNITLSSLPIYFQQKNYQINFVYENSGVTYISHQRNEIETINMLYNISERLMSLTNSVFCALRSTLASYFIVNVISFWNLCLLYNLLNINTTPLFLKLFYEQLLSKFFNLSSIMNWLNENIVGFEEKLNFVNLLDREHMMEFKHGFGWFGYFGMSSQFISNNIQQFLVMGVFIIKLFVLAKVRKIVCKQLANMFPKGTELTSIFIKQLFVAIIFMCISSLTEILKSGFIRNTEKINWFFQFLILWISIMVYPIFFLTEMKIKNKRVRQALKQKEEKYFQEKNKDKKILKKQISEKAQIKRKIKKKVFIQCLDDILDFSLNIIVPSLILFDNPTVFLAIVTLIIWMRTWWFLKYYHILNYSRTKTIFMVVNLLAWIIHHHAYIIFYILEIIQTTFAVVFGDNVFIALKICGYGSILTIIVGGICEILNFILNFLMQVHLVLKAISKKIHRNKIMPKKQKQKTRNILMDKFDSNKQNRVVITMKIKGGRKDKRVLPEKEAQAKKQVPKIEEKQEKNNQIMRRKKNVGLQKQGRPNHYLKTIFQEKQNQEMHLK